MIHELQAEDVRKATLSFLDSHLPLDMAGYQVKSEMVWHVLMKAAVEQSSVEAMSQDLAGVAHGNTLREHLYSRFSVTELVAQETAQNGALAATLPREMQGRQVNVAIDFHDEPFYGKSAEARCYVCGGQAQAGTTHFWRIATAYVMWGDMRVTLALTYVLPEHSTLDVLARLLHRVQQTSVQVKRLYLDKGFCSGEIIRFLQAHRYSAVLACAIRGTKGGTRALCRGRKRYRTTYTFTDGTMAEVAVIATLPENGQGQRQRKWLLFVLIDVDWSPRKVKHHYRRRFGIETSYRQLGRVRIHTNGVNPAWRFFILGFALLLVNIWLWLRWRFTLRLQPGRYRVQADRFRLQRFIQFLRRAIEQYWGVVMCIPTHLPPQSVIH